MRKLARKVMRIYFQHVTTLAGLQLRVHNLEASSKTWLQFYYKKILFYKTIFVIGHDGVKYKYRNCSQWFGKKKDKRRFFLFDM